MLSDKALDRLKSVLGEDTMNQMDTMNSQELKQVIVDASSSMKYVKEELDANPNYRRVKEDKSALEAGKRDVDKRQKARIGYALACLESNGGVAVEMTMVPNE